MLVVQWNLKLNERINMALSVRGLNNSSKHIFILVSVKFTCKKLLFTKNGSSICIKYDNLGGGGLKRLKFNFLISLNPEIQDYLKFSLAVYWIFSVFLHLTTCAGKTCTQDVFVN